MISLSALLDRLRSEHGVQYVYRGQAREWPGALVPSLYRPLTRSSSPFSYDGTDRLYASGTAFVEEEPVHISWGRLQPHEADQLRRHVLAAHELRHGLGYVLAQIFAQQAGLWSEGLDVTSSIDVAAFFATHDCVGGRYVRVETGTGVIYRFTVQPRAMDIEALRRLDFYTCPTFLASEDIISLFAECDSLEDAIGWLTDYRSESMLRISKDRETARLNRPLEYIRFPRGSVPCSRIARQRAGLLMPDMVLSEFWSTTDVPAPRHKVAPRTQPWIEDLSQRTGTTKHYFSHLSEYEPGARLCREEVLPASDIICDLLRAWLSRAIGSNTWIFNDYVLDARESRDDLVL